MNLDTEIHRLVELMPASGRMYCKIVSRPNQATVIAAQLPLPTQETRPIWVNFDLWQQLSEPQRDLLLLRTVSWLISIRWLKPSLYQGLAIAGVVLTSLELLQMNAAGMITFGGVTAIAIAQLWRKNRNNEVEMAADEKAVQIAQRRGYTQMAAAQALLEAVERVAQIEQRQLSFVELLRCQKLRAVITPLPLSVPSPATQD